MRVVVDTDVVLAAFLFEGLQSKLIPLWKAGQIKPYATKEIFEEYMMALAYPEFELSEQEIEYLFYKEILPCFEIAPPAASVPEAETGLPENKFVGCALAAGAEMIISGDLALLALKAYDRISIVSPAEFLKLKSDAVYKQSYSISGG